jgi:hypothetical protein
LGWSDKDNFYERLIPVCVKISNPFLLPTSSAATMIKQNSNPVDNEEEEY